MCKWCSASTCIICRLFMCNFTPMRKTQTDDSVSKKNSTLRKQLAQPLEACLLNLLFCACQHFSTQAAITGKTQDLHTAIHSAFIIWELWHSVSLFLPGLFFTWKAFWYLLAIKCSFLSLTSWRWEQSYQARWSVSLINFHIFTENGSVVIKL